MKGGVNGGEGFAAEERRRAPDGKEYAKAEFIAVYGGSVEWNECCGDGGDSSGTA